MLIDFPMYGVKIEVPNGVYAPAEDTFLLLETALKHCKAQPKTAVSGAHLSKAQVAPAKALGRSKTGNGRVLEVGTGSGLIACALAKKGLAVDAVDADENAVEAAVKNVEMNKLEVKVRKSNLFENANGKYSCIIFNPPYVPSGKGKLADRASEGGKGGREVIDRFLAELPKHLAEGGCALMLQSSLNGIGKTKAIAEKHGLTAEIVARQKLFFEEIVVMKLRRA